ncbi:MAG: hypothetical protein WBV82_22800 [Myxococcaceae bacterium]
MRRRLVFPALALGVGLAAPAFAQIQATELGQREYFRQIPPDEQEIDVQVFGGAGTAVGGISNNLGLGSIWSATAGTRITEGVGLEGGYVGSRLPFQDDRVPDGSALWRHGADVMAKMYVPNPTVLRPFGGLGVGVSYMNPSDQAEPLYQTDWVTEIPIAAGVEVESQAVFAGARLQYEWLFGEEFAANATPGESPGGGFLTGMLSVGGRFQ